MEKMHVVITILVCTTGVRAHAQGQLLLKSGFESSVQITEDMSDITWLDTVSGFDRDDTPAWIESSRFTYLVNRDKRLTDYMASFIETAIATANIQHIRARPGLSCSLPSPLALSYGARSGV